MPKQISKLLSIALFDEEVEAWQVLDAYLRNRRLKNLAKFGNRPPTTKLVMRDLLQIVAEHLKDEIGPEIATKLSAPPALSQFLMKRAAKSKAQQSLKAKAKSPKSQKPPVEKSTNRTVWDRPWRGKNGVKE